MKEKPEKDIIIFHDTFLYKWGGERLILMMGKALQADIASGFFSSGSFQLRKEGFQGEMISVSTEVFTKGIRHIKLKWAFLFRSQFLKQYKTIIFSGDSLSAVRNCRKESKKIYYCHTPPRYIYDLHHLYRKKVPLFLRPLFILWCRIFRFLYERDISRMDLIVTNSKNTQERLQKFLWVEAQILYPPVDTSLFIPGESKGYFLSFARLADAKRVDRIVEAFQKLPSEKLIVIYGKNDPQKQKIFELAKGYPNIECITLQDNNLLYDYIAHARATIYIPIDEDFGMSPVESMAAGKPVIWVNEGGLKETILHEKTWVLIPESCKIEDIIQAVEYISEEKAQSMKEACMKQAQKFSLREFTESLKIIIQK